jgi:hypothetical protein
MLAGIFSVFCRISLIGAFIGAIGGVNRGEPRAAVILVVTILLWNWRTIFTLVAERRWR